MQKDPAKVYNSSLDSAALLPYGNVPKWRCHVQVRLGEESDMSGRAFMFVSVFLAVAVCLCNVNSGQRLSQERPTRRDSRFLLPQVTETPLGKTPDDMVAVMLAAISPAGRRIAYRSVVGDRETVVIDGKAGRTYDCIEQGPILSPDETRQVAYVARRGDQTFVVVGDHEQGPYEAVLDRLFAFSPDGKRLVYAVATGDQWALIVANTRDLPPRATAQEQAYAAISPASLVFSSDGQHMAFAARRDANWVVVVDGRETRPYSRVGQIVFYPDGKQFLYIARLRDRCAVIREDRQPERLGDVYDEVADIVLSPDGRQVAYWARRADRWRVVSMDGEGTFREAQSTFEDYGNGTLVFNQNGSSLAYAGIRQDRAIVVVNGVEYGPYDAVLAGTPAFSPDGARVVYGALRKGAWHIVVDGRERAPAYGLLKEHSVQFTPDSQRVVYIATYSNTGRTMAIAVDGELSPDYLFPLNSRLVFDSARSFHTVAVVGTITQGEDEDYPRLENGQFVRVNIESPEQ